jgi:uncharacterized protein YdhG (YjbR/CyaY superfamily)
VPIARFFLCAGLVEEDHSGLAQRDADSRGLFLRREATIRTVSTVDEYVQGLTPGQRQQFERVRRIAKRLVPEAEETISYGIPTFKYRGKYLIYFAAHKNHMSVYPTVGAVEATKGTKGTFQFTEDDPVPEDVVVTIVSQRKSEIEREG